MLPAPTNYYQLPMGIIGKVYATSMLVLINSRMILDSNNEEMPSMITSVIRFGRAPFNEEDSAVEVPLGDLSSSTMIPQRGGKLRDVMSWE